MIKKLKNLIQKVGKNRKNKEQKRAKKRVKRKESESKPSTMFGELSLEEFKDKLLILYKQECALDDDETYFEPQDTLFGEMVDNSIRIKFLKEENEKYLGQYSDDEIMEKAKKLYEEDKKEKYDCASKTENPADE